MAGNFWNHWLDHIFCVYLRKVFHNPKKILVEFVKPGMTVLDIGFGKGYYSIEMARMVSPDGRVVSVEIDLRQ